MAENKRQGPQGPGMRIVEKPKNFKATMKKLINYSNKYIVVVVVAIISAGLGTVLSLFGPNQLSKLTDYITAGLMSGIDLEGVRNIGILLIGIYCISAILSFTQGTIMATVTAKISKELRKDITTKINKVPMDYYQSHTTGNLLSIITNDVDTIGQTLNQSVGSLVSSICLFVGALIMMLLTNVTLTITAVGATLIGFALMMIIMGKSQKYFAEQQKYLGLVNGHVEEMYSGHTVIKAYNAEEETKSTFKEYNSQLKTSAFKAQFLSGLMMPLMSFIGNLGYVAVCIVGAMLAMNDYITFGVIVAFIMYVRYFTQPLSQIAQAMQNLQSAGAAGERVFDFLEAKEMEEESHKTKVLKEAQGEVEFKNVYFGYNPDKIIIKDFSMTAKPGQKIAIVGPTGAGKTTLVNLLMRFNEVNSGDILIDGHSIHDLTRENIHSLFCMVLQDTWLFEGSIKENIKYSKKEASDEDVIEACKSVGLHHFIQTLPKGYDTILDDKSSISVGQKQQLTIARAMVENAPMLILDEATSSVDTRTEIQIQKAMDKLMEGRTSFVIAHRLSTIKNADIILVLKDGSVVESGNHEALMKNQGFYADLYNSQFESE